LRNRRGEGKKGRHKKIPAVLRGMENTTRKGAVGALRKRQKGGNYGERKAFRLK